MLSPIYSLTALCKGTLKEAIVKKVYVKSETTPMTTPRLCSKAGCLPFIVY